MNPVASRLLRIIVLVSVMVGALLIFKSPRAASLGNAEARQAEPAEREVTGAAGGYATNLDAPAQKAAAGKSEINQKQAQEQVKEALQPPRETVCAQIWGVDGSSSFTPDWLYTPVSANELATSEPYTYLAGRMLQAGLVSAPGCPFNGLLASGYASPCGLEKVRQQVNEWQNQFDQRIFQAAVENAVPARLLKKIFAQESQFWLGDSPDQIHFGVGHITEGGLDPLFLSYPEYYQQVCTDVLSADTCKSKYADLPSHYRGMIRGYFLHNVIDVSCPECAKKFDENKALKTIDLFAKLLVANCEQVNRVVVDITEKKPAAVSTYDDLWRLTLVNYNSGSGCVSGAVERAYKAGEALNWDNLAEHLQAHCQSAQEYVEKISQ